MRKFDGFWCKRLNIWDIAAGILLVREAGGICLNDKGSNFDTINDDSLIASSSSISGELFKKTYKYLLDFFTVGLYFL